MFDHDLHEALFLGGSQFVPEAVVELVHDVRRADSGRGYCCRGEQNRFLIATPEKALFDKVAYDRRFEDDDPEAYLLDDLRLDEESLRRLNKTRLKELATFMTGRLKPIYNYLEDLR